jgi:hypothetical protein
MFWPKSAKKGTKGELSGLTWVGILATRPPSVARRITVAVDIHLHNGIGYPTVCSDLLCPFHTHSTMTKQPEPITRAVAAKTKVTVFWDAASCSLVEVYRRFRGVYSLHHQGPDGDSKHLWNVGKLPDHGAASQKTVIFILAAVRTWNIN